ncbi:hypothetical protein QBC39DRAFT_169898 [Podospora conica]|nr:hypothetical protein QBC39DRAFT_169898 [Schizothecium conicum]
MVLALKAQEPETTGRLESGSGRQPAALLLNAWLAAGCWLAGRGEVAATSTKDSKTGSLVGTDWIGGSPSLLGRVVDLGAPQRAGWARSRPDPGLPRAATGLGSSCSFICGLSLLASCCQSCTWYLPTSYRADSRAYIQYCIGIVHFHGGRGRAKTDRPRRLQWGRGTEGYGNLGPGCRFEIRSIRCWTRVPHRMGVSRRSDGRARKHAGESRCLPVTVYGIDGSIRGERERCERGWNG